MSTHPVGTILSSRVKGGIAWVARISADRGRLQVVAIVPPSSEATEIEPLSEPELLQLLGADQDDHHEVSR